MKGRQAAPRFAVRFALPALLALAGWPALAAEPAKPQRPAMSLTPAVPATPSKPAMPQGNLSADERLDAIRHGLVQAALEGATRVESVSWLDMDGRLHESSSFRSGMQVRGVQVLAYVRDPEGEPRARLQLPAAEGRQARRDLYKDTLKDALPAKPAPACPSDGLRHLIGLSVAVGGRWPAQDAPMAHALAEMLSAAWPQAPAAPQAGGVQNWRLLADGDGAIKTADDMPRTAYERALLGGESSALPWSATLEVLPGLPPAAGQGPAFLHSLWGQTPSTARISLSLSPNKNYKPKQGQAQAALKLSAEVPLLREPGQWTAPQLSPAGRAQVQAVLALWSQAISAQLVCEPVRPEVLPTAGGLLRLNAGALAGVQPGEEWLLADPAAFPERLLAPGTVQQLVLAKVHKVHAGYAELHVLAGAVRPVQAGWRAWRAQSPLGD